jgi:ABC-type nitrate/sulfonate/bicarbonate transport system substrate-binding protein
MAATTFSVAAQDLRKVTIGVASTSISGGVARIAKEMGLFEKHGLSAAISAMDSGAVATAALLSGSLDFSSGGGSEVVVAQARGQKLVSVLPLYGGFGAVLVLAKSVAGKLSVAPNAPALDRIKALDGLIIATPAASATPTFALKPSAEALGVKVRFTYMNFQAMSAALESGAIQGFVASAPFYAVPVIKGSGIIWLRGQKGDFPPENTPQNYSVLNTRLDYALANPEVIARIRAVFADFARAADERPGDIKAAIGRLFPDLDAKMLDLLFETELPGFKTTPLTREHLSHEIGFVKRTGQLPNVDKLDPEAMMLR